MGVIKQYQLIVINILGMLVSFFVLDFGFRLLITNEIDYYHLLEISPNLFSLSNIFLIIGILFLIKIKIRKVVYLSLNIIMIFITYFEYLLFQKERIVTSIIDLFYYDLISLIQYTDFKIIIVIGLSLVICLLTSHFMKNQKSIINNKYDLSIIVLVFIIIIGTTRGIATMALGPEVILSSNKQKEAPKNIYLYDINSVKKIEVSGIYEYLIIEEIDNFIFQFNYNQEKIKENYE